jgi:hypothetical protein
MPINVFGEGAVQTAYVGYREFAMTEDLDLLWPNAYQDTPNTAAAFMRVTTTSTTGLILTLPDATQVSVGQNFIIVNTSSNAFSLSSKSGADLGSIDIGISYYYILQDNSTEGGVWRRVTFGAGNADVDAAELAGLGLDAVAGKLNTSTPVVSTVGPYTVTSAQNAALIVWTGGGGTLTLPNVATVDDGFFFSLNNEGSGEVTIIGDKPIDNQAAFVVGISQSLTLVKAANNWWTLGFGQQTFFSVNVLNKTVAGNTDVILSANEAARNIQQYDGALTGNITVFFPVEANEWTIYNRTTGAFTLSVQLRGGGVPVGTAYIVPQGNTQIFYSDGTTMRVTPSIISPSGITFPSGTEPSPGIAFTSDPDTGIYNIPVGNVIGISSGGVAAILAGSSVVDIMFPTTIHQHLDVTNTMAVTGAITATGGIGASALSLSSPLDIIYGGTGQITAPLAIKALMPTATLNGTMVYYDGTNWIVLPPGTNGQVLTMVAGVPAWA